MLCSEVAAKVVVIEVKVLLHCMSAPICDLDLCLEFVSRKHNKCIDAQNIIAKYTKCITFFGRQSVV